jgi:cytochrome oxidase Cu insertion factor (SCO1/SenC/PrrC family)
MTMTASRAPDTVRGRRSVLALAALFLVPLVAAFWLYYGTPGWRPRGAANQGELVDPAVPLPVLEFAAPDGRRIAGDLLRDRWTLLFIGPSRCDARCRDALYLTRQTRLALNKDADRVRRVFLATGTCCPDARLLTAHPDLIVATPTESQLEALRRLIPALDSAPVTDAGRIYIVDPLGNLMMSYAAAAPDKALLDDLERLLRLSHIG